jgi:hypothetical protein
MRCEDFLSWLEDPALQEGGPWPQEILLHARRCPRCAEVLAIFTAIPSEVARSPRASDDGDEPAAVVLALHNGIPAVMTPPSRRRYGMVPVAVGLAVATLMLALPWHMSAPPLPDSTRPDSDGLASETPASHADPSGEGAADLAAAVAARTDDPVTVHDTSPIAIDDGVAFADAAPTDLADGRRRVAAHRPVVQPEPTTTVEVGPATLAVLSPEPTPLVMPPLPTRNEPAATTSTGPATSAGPATSTPERREATVTVARRQPEAPDNVEIPRVRVGQGVLVMSDDWGDGAGYSGEVGLQQRFWFDRHVGMSVDGGVRYGVAPGFDALPDSKPRTATGGTVAGAGSVMFAVRARPALVGLGVGFSAGEWDPGPDACSDLQRAAPERNVACDEWSYVTPDLVASVEFDVTRDVRLGLRWTGHDQGYELGRNGEVPTGGDWINRVTIEATFRPGADGIAALMARKGKKRDRDDTDSVDASRTAITVP